MPRNILVAGVCAAVFASLLVGCSAKNDAVKLSIDGKRFPVDGPVSCSSHSAGFAISAGEEPNDVFVRLLPGGESRVGEVYLGSFSGTPLRYDGNDSGSDLAYDDMTYTITGDAVEDTSPAPSTPGETTPFTLVVTCPSEDG